MDFTIDNSNVDMLNTYLKKDNKITFKPGKYEITFKKECFLKIIASGGQGGNGGSGEDIKFYDSTDCFKSRQDSWGWVWFYGGSGGSGGPGAICSGNIYVAKNTKFIFSVGKQGYNGSSGGRGLNCSGKSGERGKDGEETSIFLGDKLLVKAYGGTGGEGGTGGLMLGGYRNESSRDGTPGSNGHLIEGSINTLDDNVIKDGKNIGDGSLVIEVLKAKQSIYIIKNNNKYYSLKNEHLKELQDFSNTGEYFIKNGFENLNDLLIKKETDIVLGVKKDNIYEFDLPNNLGEIITII